MYRFYYSQVIDDEDNYGAESSNLKDRQNSGLQEICLLAILENFDRYCAAFKMRNSIVPRKHFEFLARRFTERIFQELKATWRLKSEHFELLINPYMKNLDIVGIDKSLLPDLIEKLKRNGNSVLTLKTHNHSMDEDICKSLMPTLPRVEDIVYQDEGFPSRLETNSFMKKIFRFVKISVPKHFVEIPPVCEAIGKNCHFLKSLTLKYDDLSSTKEYDDGIAFILKHCPFLEKLQYRDTVGALYRQHKSDFSSSINLENDSVETNVAYVLKNLSSSEERSYELRDALLICNAVCPYVSCLHIDYLNGEKELKMISRFTHLEEVKFRFIGRRMSASSLENFLNLRGSKLTSLEMPYKFGLSVEKLIESCPNLQSLKLNKVQLPEHSSASEQSCKLNLPHLKTVKFSFSDFTIPGATTAALKSILSAAKCIETLSLNGSMGLTNKLFRSLPLGNIRVLDVSFSDITVEPLIELLVHGTLKKLRIKRCERLSRKDYIALTHCLSDINKNVSIEYQSFWGWIR